MNNDGSLDSTAESIVGLLNNDSSNTGVHTTEQQVEEVAEELINTGQPDSESAVSSEDDIELEQLSDVEQEETQQQETEIPDIEPTYSVKVQGQEYDVSLEELKNGYSRDNDYRIKTETLAIERNQFKEEQAKNQTNLSEKLAQLDQMQDYARQQLQIDASGLNELMESDPVEGMRKKHQLEQRAKKIHNQNAFIEEQKAETHEKFLLEQQKQMYLKIPELKNPETRKVFNSTLVSYLEELNFNPDEIRGVSDHRYVQLISDGMKYRALQKRRPAMNKKVAGATPMEPFTMPSEPLQK